MRKTAHTNSIWGVLCWRRLVRAAISPSRSLCSSSDLSVHGCVCSKVDVGRSSTARNMVSDTDPSNMIWYRVLSTPRMASFCCKICQALPSRVGCVVLLMLPCVASHSCIVFVAALVTSRRMRQDCFGCIHLFCRVWRARLAPLQTCSLLPLTRASMLHSAWPMMMHRKGVGRAPTRSGAMGIILHSAPANRNCAAHAAAARIIRAAAEELVKQRARHLKRFAHPASWGYGFLFWICSWTTSLGPTSRS